MIGAVQKDYKRIDSTGQTTLKIMEFMLFYLFFLLILFGFQTEMHYFLTAPVSVSDASPQRVTIREGLELPFWNFKQ